MSGGVGCCETLAGCGEQRGDSPDRDAGQAPAEGGEERLGGKRPRRSKVGAAPAWAVSSTEGFPDRAAARPPRLRADQEQLLPNAGWLRGAADAASAHGPVPGGDVQPGHFFRQPLAHLLFSVFCLFILWPCCVAYLVSAPQSEADPWPLQWTLGGLTAEPAGNCPCSSGSYTFTAYKISISVLKIFLYFSYLPIPLSLFYHSFHIAL